MQPGPEDSPAPVVASGPAGRASGSAATQPRAPPAGGEEQAASKRRRASAGGGVSKGNEWLRAWAWKREHRPDKVRFHKPYLHPLSLRGGGAAQLTVHQAPLTAQGFASTVWDSSIVLAKLFEKHPARWAGRRALDLSAGCGLPGLVLARLGAAVVATDLEPNLALLRKNAEANGCDIAVVEHTWGQPPCAALQPRFDVIAACDVMYVCEAIPALVASLAALVAEGGEVYVSHGRNRQAEPEFLQLAAAHFSIESVGSEELDEVYQSADVDVLRLRPLPDGAARGAAGSAAGKWMERPVRRQAEDEAGLERAAKRLLSAAAVAAAGQPAAAGPAPQPRAALFNLTNSLQAFAPAVVTCPPAPTALPQPAALLQRPPAATVLPQPGNQLLRPSPLHHRAHGLPAAAFVAKAGHGLPPRTLPPARVALPRSPGWPACSTEQPRQASEDGSSPPARLHVLAADVREAANSGAGKLTKSLEPLLFIQSGAINPALATRNRKTELDIVEPPAAVRSLVQAFEALCSRLAAHGGDARTGLMQEAMTAGLDRVLRPGNGSARSLASARLQGNSAYAAAALRRARQAVLTCAEEVDAALAGLAGNGGSGGGGGGAAAALVVLEAMQRFGVRCILPVAPAGGLYAFPWLEEAVWACCAALRPAGPAQPEGWPPMSSRRALESTLARLHEVHEALEDAAGRLPEEDRQRACRAVLCAAGGAALGAHVLRAGAGAALDGMCASCLDALGPGSTGVHQRVEAALTSASRLAGRTHKVAAAAELLERAARVMRLDPSGFPQCMWQLLSALQLD